jgi:hypothetical protein
MRKIVIDPLTSASGWVVNSPSTVTTQAYPQFIAGLNDSSIQIKFDLGDTVKTATKTLTPVDVTDQKTLILSIWSRMMSRQDYNKKDDFVYKLKINSTAEYYLPIYNTFTHIEIGIEEITSIDRIEITALHETTDYIIISEMVTEQEIIPLDILEETKLDLEKRVLDKFGDGIIIGTMASGTTGDTSITFDAIPDFVDSYSVVKIKDGFGEELVHLGDRSSNTFQLIAYEGVAGGLQNDYTTASVYLQFPVYLNPNEIDIRLPGIALWGISGTPIFRGGKLDIFRDTYTETTIKERKAPQLYEYPVQADCQARHYELIDKMARIVREFISCEKTWINGRKNDAKFDGPAVEQRPQVGFDIIPKLQYNFIIEVSENRVAREAVNIFQNATVTVEPRE